MTNEEQSLLAKGLKFCPTPTTYNRTELNNDIDSICRKMRLQEYFHDKTWENFSIVKPQSTWVPEGGRNTTLDTVISSLKLTKTIQNIPPQRYKNNTNKLERNAIKSLGSRTDIIIKEADKGSAVVLMNTDFYKNKVMDILNDEETYKKIPHNRDQNTMHKIKITINNYSNILTKDEIRYLTQFEYKTSLFYGLPKIHKSKLIINTITRENSEYVSVRDPMDLKLRPIVAGPACPTHRISHLLDIVLQPFLEYVPAYLKNNLDFLNNLPQQLNDNEIFITLDVVSLYSNIRPELGHDAMNYWIDNFYDGNNRIPATLIKESCKLVLENNSFEFCGENYLQISGTAMGTKFAPNYANLVLGFLEQKLHSQIKGSYGDAIATKLKTKYMRYLDDVFIIWDTTDGSFQPIFDMLNKMDPKIAFTCDSSGDTATFLDVKITKVNNKVITDIHYKETDTKQYLQYNSHHPRHIKNNIPFNLARRICTIVSDKKLKKQRLTELEGFLLKRKYPKGLIRQGIEKANKIPLSTLRNPTCNRRNREDDIMTYVSTYNPNHCDFYKEVKFGFELLKNSPETENIYRNVSLIKAKRQPNNLKKILTRAQFKETSNKRVKKCENERCSLCLQIIEGAKFRFPHTDSDFIVNNNMNCSTLNCVYLLQCCGCKEIYIGETSNLRNRINLHRDHINHNKGLYVSKHIFQCATNSTPKFKVMPFYKVKSDDTQLRKNKETNFIEKYKPKLNRNT